MLQRLLSGDKYVYVGDKKMYTYIENGAIRRTTCCEFLGPFRLGIRAGSKSGGKYLFNTGYS
jgi:hypothetical protein